MPPPVDTQLPLAELDVPKVSTGAETPLGAAKDGRVRRRRRYGLVTVTGVVASISLASSGFVSPLSHVGKLGGAPSSASSRAAFSGLLVVNPGGGAAWVYPGPLATTVTNVGTGRAWAVPLPGKRQGGTVYPWIVRQGGIVVVEGTRANGGYQPAIGSAYLIHPDRSRSPINLGPASWAVAAVQPGRVWLMTDTATPVDLLNGTLASSRCTAREVAVTGAPASPTFKIPCGRAVDGAVMGGLLTDIQPVAQGPLQYQVWNPFGRKVVRDIIGPGGTLEGNNARFLAWGRPGSSRSCPQGSCSVSFADVSTGHSSQWRPPRGLYSWGPIVLAPGKSNLFATVAIRASVNRRFSDLNREFGPLSGINLSVPARLIVANASSGRLISSRSITLAFEDSVVWSPSGRYVFVTRDQSHAVAYPALFSRAKSHVVSVEQAKSHVVSVEQANSLLVAMQ